MSKEYQNILIAALELQRSEQFSLVQALLEKMKAEIEDNDSISSEQLAELDRRMLAFRNGKIRTIPGEEAMQKLRKASEL